MNLTQIAFWHWWVAAAVLAILEMVMPGTMLLWFAVAAGAVGLAVMLVPVIPWQVQLIAFAVLSVGAIYGWKRYQAKNPKIADNSAPTLNKRADQYIGRAVTLNEAIVNGHGKAKVDDTVWRVTGPDLPEGTTVKVIASDGAFLKVEKA
jgi:membrane protein implicated in regulation of membrane protease activity